MPPYFNGLLFGLIFVFSFGPGFFSLVQTSVQQGLRKAVFLAVGISLSDFVYVTLAILGAASFLDEPDVRLGFAIGGAVVLLGYGIYSWFKKPKIYPESTEKKIDKSYLKYTLKGFVLNGLNPFILVFWIGIIGIVAVKYDYNFSQQVYFFLGVVSTILTMDLIKAFLANKLRRVITPKFILILNRSIGSILILFAARIIFFLFQGGGEINIPVP
ncbi:MAG: LysE family translocator [Cyclobacteriaceae bacterium]